MDEYERRGNKSPAPKTSFQRELEARMRERKMKGLSADITPSDSAQGSDEELNSDDELLDGFNMTAKHGNNKWQRKSPVPNGRGSPAVGHSSNNSYSGRKSPYEPGGKSAVDELFGRKTPTKYTEDDGDEEPADLMMTMRKPWAPPGSRKTNDDRKPAAAPRKPWQPPAMRKANLEEDEEEEEEEDYRPTRQQQRPKSPSVRGRRTPVDLDAIEEDSEDRAPQPRARGARGSTADEPKPKPKPRRASSKYEEEEEEEFKKKARKSPTTDIFSSKPRPKTPTKDTEKKVQSRYMKGKSTEKEEGRKTPTGKKTPEPKKPSLLDEMSGGDASKNKKKTRGLLKDDTDSDDSCDREPGRRLGLGRRGKSPYDDGPDRYGRRTPEDRYSNDRKSPFRRDGEDEYDGRGPDRYDRKSPFRRVGEDEYDHQYPDRNNRMSAFDGPRLKKSQSRDDDENGYGQYERRGKENQPTHAQRKSRSQTKSPHDDRESSLCRDVEKDPGPMRKSDTQEGKEIKKRELKAQTSENQLLESAIRNVKDINDKTDQFKPVEPDGGNSQKMLTNCARPVPKQRFLSKPTITPRSSTLTRKTISLDSTNSASSLSLSNPQLQSQKNHSDPSPRYRLSKLNQTTSDSNLLSETKQHGKLHAYSTSKKNVSTAYNIHASNSTLLSRHPSKKSLVSSSKSDVSLHHTKSSSLNSAKSGVDNGPSPQRKTSTKLDGTTGRNHTPNSRYFKTERKSESKTSKHESVQKSAVIGRSAVTVDNYTMPESNTKRNRSSSEATDLNDDNGTKQVSAIETSEMDESLAIQLKEQDSVVSNDGNHNESVHDQQNEPLGGVLRDEGAVHLNDSNGICFQDEEMQFAKSKDNEGVLDADKTQDDTEDQVQKAENDLNTTYEIISNDMLDAPEEKENIANSANEVSEHQNDLVRNTEAALANDSPPVLPEQHNSLPPKIPDHQVSNKGDDLPPRPSYSGAHYSPKHLPHGVYKASDLKTVPRSAPSTPGPRVGARSAPVSPRRSPRDNSRPSALPYSRSHCPSGCCPKSTTASKSLTMLAVARLVCGSSPHERCTLAWILSP